MKRNVLFRSCTFSVALAMAVVFCLQTGDAHAAPRRDQLPEPRLPHGDPPPPRPDGAFSGPFGGQTIVVLRDALPNRTTEVEHVNLREILDLAWTVSTPKIESRINGYLTMKIRDHRGGKTVTRTNTGYNLYDVSVALGPASGATLRLTVNPNSRLVTLNYRVPDNHIRFKASITGPNPTIKVNCALELTATLAPSGNASAPLAVKSAAIAIRNAKVDVDGNLLFDIVKAVAEFFTGKDFEAKIAKAINGQSNNLTADVRQALGFLNNKLRTYTQARGYSDLAPRYDSSAKRLVIELRRPAPQVKGVFLRATSR